MRLPSFLFPEVILPTDEDATLYKYLLTLLKPAGSSFPFIYPLICLVLLYACLLYTSDAADERSSVDLGGRRIIKKKNKIEQRTSISSAQHHTNHINTIQMYSQLYHNASY